MTGRFTQISSQAGEIAFSAAHWTAPMPIKMRKVPNIYTLHDLVPLQFPYFVVGYGDRMHRMHEIIAREADHIITVSEASKRHIVKILKVPDDHVTVTCQPVKELPNVGARRRRGGRSGAELGDVGIVGAVALPLLALGSFPPPGIGQGGWLSTAAM